MDIYKQRQRWNQILLVMAMLIGAGSLWYTNQLVNHLKTTERQKMELWAEAIRIMNLASFETELAFPFSVIESNKDIPVILTDADHNILQYNNLDSARVQDQRYLRRQLDKAMEENDSLMINLNESEYQLLFYRDSNALRKLSYFPYIQLGIIILFMLVSYLAFSFSRRAEQNEVWTGMSKETAHQLGTPISSLMGWMELLKQSELDQNMVGEMQKDADRLEKIADRFSKIGSKPTLERTNLSGILTNSVAYMQGRSPKSIEYILDLPEQPLFSELNGTLFEWVIENLCKNAADAIKKSGRVILHGVETKDHVIIDVEDSGKGISKSRFKTIFKPGYTTKKRGWGLGLSLSKRIVESYHHGRIFVLSSDPGDSTIIRIMLPKHHERSSSL